MYLVMACPKANWTIKLLQQYTILQQSNDEDIKEHK